MSINLKKLKLEYVDLGYRDADGAMYSIYSECETELTIEDTPGNLIHESKPKFTITFDETDEDGTYYVLARIFSAEEAAEIFGNEDDSDDEEDE